MDRRYLSIASIGAVALTLGLNFVALGRGG
jgi:hypothetical protein